MVVLLTHRPQSLTHSLQSLWPSHHAAGLILLDLQDGDKPGSLVGTPTCQILILIRRRHLKQDACRFLPAVWTRRGLMHLSHRSREPLSCNHRLNCIVTVQPTLTTFRLHFQARLREGRSALPLVGIHPILELASALQARIPDALAAGEIPYL